MQVIANRIFLAMAVLICVLYFTACTTVNAGGVTLPNGIAGHVKDSNGLPIPGALVTARLIIITSQGEETIASYQVQTDSNGQYQFNSIQQGEYIVTINYRNINHLIPLVAVSEIDTANIGESILEHASITLIGRVLGASNITVKIPGMDFSTTADENGEYQLSGVPPQELRIAFISPHAVNYLLVNIAPHHDTIYLRDIAFAHTLDQARGLDNFYSTTLQNSFAVIPIAYPIDSVPAWYDQKDFSRVEYITLRNASFTFLPASGNWNNPANWDLQRVPLRGDTALIAGSSCIVDIDSVLPLTFAGAGSEIIVNQNAYFENFSLTKSTIRTDGENLYIWLQGTFNFSDTNQIRVNLGSLAVFNGIFGEGVIYTGWRGDVQIDGEFGARDFSGSWFVEAGKLRLRMVNSIGYSEINILPNATLDIETNWALNRAQIIRLFTQDSLVGSMELDASPTIPIMEINGERLAPGQYSRDNLPEFIRGSGAITVSQ